MSHVNQSAASGADPERSTDPSLGSLVSQLSSQIPELIRTELRLAQAEMAQKGKRAGIGLGMVSAAGLLAFFGLAGLITTAILALALAVPPWVSALIVTAVLLVAAGIAALLGKQKVAEATPPVPQQTVENVKKDVATVKGDRA